MADLVLTADRIRPLDENAIIFPMIAAEAITPGQIVYQTSAGKAGVADANDAGKQQARGVAMNGGGAGQEIDVLVFGRVGGFTISQAYDARLFLSDTAGAVADAAGTMTVPVGRVVPLTDPSLTKVIFFDFSYATQWA